VNELYDEKIDIVRWNQEIGAFIGEALSPAKAVKVTVNEEQKSAFVIVPDNQLSLAIGKAGQNVRLAARLTGWRIDIRSEAQVARTALMAITSPLEDEEETEEQPSSESMADEETFGLGASNVSALDGHLPEDTDHALVQSREAAETADAEETSVR